MKAIYQCLKFTSLVISVGLIPLAIPALAQQTESYPSEVVQSFMESCVSNGGTEAMCSCVIEGIQAEYSLEEFTQITTEIETKEPPAKLVEIAQSCMSSQEQSGN